MIDPGDDSVVLHLAVRLLPGESAFGYDGPGDVAQFVRDVDGGWNLLLSLDRAGHRRRYALPVRPDSSPGRRSDGRFVWAITRSSGGTVRVAPSIHVPGDVHVVVTVTDASDPAPWRPA